MSEHAKPSLSDDIFIMLPVKKISDQLPNFLIMKELHVNIKYHYKSTLRDFTCTKYDNKNVAKEIEYLNLEEKI